MKCEPSEWQPKLFFSLILVWLIAMICGISEPPIVVRGVAWLGIVIGVSAAWFGLKQMFRKGPTLIINESGIDDRRLGIGQIPWTAILVVLALFVAIDPEARIFLMFLDSVGVDLFVTLCVLFLRHNLVLVAAILLIPILKWTYRRGPVPGFWPSKLVIRSSATWASYAVVVPVITLCGAAMAAICIAAVLASVVRLLGLI